MPRRADRGAAATSGPSQTTSSKSQPAARMTAPRHLPSVTEEDRPHPSADPLDILAELELFPAGRPATDPSAPTAAPSWTLAEEPPAPPAPLLDPLERWPPAVDAAAAAAAETERRRWAASVLKLAPGEYQLEPETDEPRGAVRPHYTSVGVGRVSRLEEVVASLQRRYRTVLESLGRDAAGLEPPLQEAGGLLPPLVSRRDAALEPPGTEDLTFARSCLEQLNTALLTGPFNYRPELEEPADRLRSALRQLLSTAAALHHELELRSMAHSRHRLLLQALRRLLQLQYRQRVTEAMAEVRAQRRLDMERLSGQIEVNVALVRKLAGYVDQTERASAGRGRVQDTYVRLLELTSMKRREVLMYRALLIDTAQHGERLRSQLKIMRSSIAQLIRSDSLHELISEQYAEEVESEMIVLQDEVTQTHVEIEEGHLRLRRAVLRKNKAIQLERRLRGRTEPLVREIRRLTVLTADAEQATETGVRSLATLTRRWSEVHEQVQTARITVRNAVHLLDDHVLEQLEMEGQAAEMDIGPLIRELQVLEEELQSVQRREHEARGRHADLRRRRQSLTADRNKMRVAVADTMDSISGALRDMRNMGTDHQTVMTLLKEQLELTYEMLRASRQKWAEINRLQGMVDLDLETMRAQLAALLKKLADRRDVTSGILSNTNAQTEGAQAVREALLEAVEEEQDIVQHLRVVVAELQDSTQPALQKAQALVDHLSSQTQSLRELKDRQTERLAAQRARTAERAREVAELRRQVEEMEEQKEGQQRERDDLIEKRREKTRKIAEFGGVVRAAQNSYSALCRRLSQEQLEQEQLITELRSWQRQVALCNAGYQIEIARMKRQLKAFYDRLEWNVRQEIEMSRRKMKEAETELRQLTELHNQKNAAALERDWQLRAALLASSEAAERSLQPVQRAMAGLDAERRKLVRMVATAVNMRPFGRVEVKIDQPVCPLPEQG